MTVDAFIERWKSSGGSEESNAKLFLRELCGERRAEEEEGHVRYLRPEYQAPEPLDWPSDLKTRAQAVRAVMTDADEPLTVEQVAQHFHRARRSDVQDLLEMLAALGHGEATGDGAYAT